MRISIATITSATVLFSMAATSTTAAFVGQNQGSFVSTPRDRHASAPLRNTRPLFMSTTVAPTLADLSKEWASMNSDHDNVAVANGFVQQPQKAAPVHSPPPNPPAPPQQPTADVYGQLAQEWASLNEDHDGMSITPQMAAAPVPPVSAVAPPALEQAPPPAGPNLEDLAKAWSEINREVGDQMKPTPPIVYTPPPPPAVEAAPVAPVASLAPVDWAALAKEWAALNKNVDEVILQTSVGMPSLPPAAPTAAVPAAPIVSFEAPSDGSGSEDWETMASELSHINKEAEETFSALTEMEAEMHDMIEKLRVRDALYQNKYHELQENSARREHELRTQLESVRTEYATYQNEQTAASQAAQQQAAEQQAQLHAQIAKLQENLQSKMDLLQQESAQVQLYMQKHAALEQELADTKHAHKQEHVAEQERQIRNTKRRIEMLQKVHTSLQAMSSGSREIMSRMRLKFQETAAQTFDLS